MQKPKTEVTGKGTVRTSHPTESRSVLTIATPMTFTSSCCFNFLPNTFDLADAPEISHLTIKRRNLNFTEEHSEFLKIRGCSSKCKDYFARIATKLKNFRKRNTGDFEDLGPVLPRTGHTVDFIKNLADGKPNASKSLILEGLFESSTEVEASETSILTRKRAYRAAYDGLIHLQTAGEILKQLILILTFTRYADERLSESELNLIKGKTVVGSYIWMVTYALQQLQDDPDVSINGYPAIELKDVFRAMEQLVCQTVYLWKALTHTVETLEGIHKNVEKTFATLVNTFPHHPTSKVSAPRHIKIYRKGQRKDTDSARVEQYNEQKSAQTWTAINLTPLRLLYRDERDKLKGSWMGYDVLTTGAKIMLLKTVQHELNLICHTVLNQLEKIDRLLHSNIDAGAKKDSAPIQCFQDGILLMEKCLEELPPASWTLKNIHDFMVTSKIILDTLDLITVGTATVRTLIHEARRIVHISYQTTRNLEYLECKVMDAYEDVVEDCVKAIDHRMERGSNTTSGESHQRRKKSSVYDIEERNLGVRDAALEFDRSIYQDILKDLPIYCKNRTVGLTLQDAEAVFSTSSLSLLAKEVPSHPLG